tara:strand:+ start:1527 stop:2492 length:966 start_codon:yes stop_codon:yes gene_type:complete
MKNKYGIYTIAIGEYAREYSKLCLPSQKAYAKDVGADHYLLDENDLKSEYPTPHFLLWEAMEQFIKSDHERFLFIDADIMIQKGTPNIFDEFSKGKMYMRFGHSFDKIVKWVKESRANGNWPSDDNFDPTGAMEKYYSSGAVLADREQVQKFLEVAKPPFVVGPWQGEMAHYNYFLAKGNIPVEEMHPRWHFTRVWADGYKGKSLQSAGVDKLEDIYFMHYAVPGNKIIAIKNDRHIYGYLGYDNTQEGSSNVNVGMVILSQKHLSAPIMNNRLDIEDNIGEGIHIHYKNLRLDFTIEDYIELAKACDTSLRKYMEMAQTP